jgi:hypothetical protein
MDLENYLLEVQLKTTKSINSIFNVALKQIFQPEFLRKIENTLRKTIKIREIDNRNQKIVAYNQGSSIYINKRPFGALVLTKKMNYLLHEFIHVLQNMRRFFLFRGFKEINDMTADLNDVVKSNLVKSFPEFLTGKSVRIGGGDKYEILAYAMNGTLDWTALTKEGQEKFVKILREYGVFNLENQFWHSRLP